VLEALPGDEIAVAVRDTVLAASWRSVGHSHASPPVAKQDFP
jgi:hypothetical protein